MPVIHKRVSVNLSRLGDAEMSKFTETTGLDPRQIPTFTIPVGVSVSLQDFDAEEIEERYEELFPRGGSWLDRVYRYLAEGDCNAAMEELQSEFGLAPPSHERAIVDLLSGRKGSNHVQSQ